MWPSIAVIRPGPSVFDCPFTFGSTVRWRHGHEKGRRLQNSLPRQDSNLESSAPEADALSIRPRETLEDVYGDYGHHADFSI